MRDCGIGRGGEQFFRMIVESSTDSIEVIDLEGHLRFLSARGLELLQFNDPDRLIGQPWSGLWPLAEQPAVTAAVEDAKRGEIATFSAVRPTGRGVSKTWDVILSPMRDETGQVISALAVSRDVSKIAGNRREAAARELALRRSEAALKSAARIAKVAGWEVDLRSGCVHFSDELWQLLGRSPQPGMQTTSALNFWAPEYRAAFAKLLEETAQNAGRLIFEGEILKPRGKRIWLRVMGEPALEGETRVALRGAAQDITAERAAIDRLEVSERLARAASDAKSKFLATMSHEIRTPLNGVLGMAQAMAADDLSSSQRERLDVIRQSGHSLLSLLNDLLDLSKIEAGRLDLEDGVIDVDELANGALAAFTNIAGDKGVYFQVDIGQEAKGCWRGDPTRIRQLLYNVVGNALKFTEQGSVRVGIEHDETMLSIRVADTGPGIPAEKQATLFDKFVQADASMTRKYGGSGLGLAICRELATLMGGEITLKSAPGD